MSILERIEPSQLTPARLWSELDSQTRRHAANAVYRGGWEDDSWRREADAFIAAKLRFRESAVRRLPVERRVGYLCGSLRPDDSLAASLLLALHLGHRVALLEAFLEALEIPHEGGLIRDDYDGGVPNAERLKTAVDELYGRFSSDEVDLYLASLIAMEPEFWSDLAAVLQARR